MLELKREDHVRAQKDTLIFIALPFTYVPKGLEMVSIHATVVAGKEIDKKSWCLWRVVVLLTTPIVFFDIPIAIVVS